MDRYSFYITTPATPHTASERGPASGSRGFVHDVRNTEPVAMVFEDFHPGMTELITRLLNETWAEADRLTREAKNQEGSDGEVRASY